MMKRDTLEPNRYEYLSKEDSKLYDSVKDSQEPDKQKIKELLEQKAASCRSDDCRSTY